MLHDDVPLRGERKKRKISVGSNEQGAIRSLKTGNFTLTPLDSDRQSG